PAIRDRGRARDSCPRRPERQSRRCPHRARSNDNRGRTGTYSERPHGRSARYRAAARRAERGRRSAVGLSLAGRLERRADLKASPVLAEPTRRAPRQARRPRSSARAEGSESAPATATIAKLEAIVPIIQQRVDVRGALYNREFSSKLQYLETLQQLVDQKQELEVQRSRYRETEAAVAA